MGTQKKTYFQMNSGIVLEVFHIEKTEVRFNAEGHATFYAKVYPSFQAFDDDLPYPADVFKVKVYQDQISFTFYEEG